MRERERRRRRERGGDRGSEREGGQTSVVSDTVIHKLEKVTVLHGCCHTLLVIDLLVNWKRLE